MQEYVVDLPSDLIEELREMEAKARSLMVEGNFQDAEAIFGRQYELIRNYENRLPEGQRHHKGAPLHNWGITMLLQKTPQKISKGYRKILLAYIEDLLDFDTIEQVHGAPAYRTLANNPFITSTLLNLVQIRVEERKARHQIPRNPGDVLQPISEAEEALEKPIEVTLDQVKDTMHAWLEDRGPKERRVFIGGNYRNMAILKFIWAKVDDFDFVPIMPIDLPATSEPSHEKLIHDISIEMLEACSFAIFEVTISDGHLMEIERARDFEDLKVILVYQTIKHNERPTVTRMLMTTGFEKEGYRNFSELTTVIHRFLSPD